jgi:YbbR domain-containing protein
MFHWLATNIRTFLLALALALVVWVTAVTAANPDETQTFPTPIAIDFIGQDPGLVITGTVTRNVQVTLRAPHSVWATLLSGEVPIKAIVDLTGVTAGTQTVQVQLQIPTQPVRIISITPQKFSLSLEKLVTTSFPIELSLTGEPAIGYKAGDVTLDPSDVVVSGPESFVAQVKRVRASLDLTNARQDIDTSLPVRVENASGALVDGISVHPDSVKVSLPVAQQGGYRDLAVKVMVSGTLASGYRITNISALPLTVTVYSEDIPLIESLPGYVETSILDLSGASKSIVTNLSLNLPGGVLLIGNQTVSVTIDIAPIEDSRQVSYRTVEMIGLGTGLYAQLSPTTVDVILGGPLPLLNTLQPSDVHVQVDLTGLKAGTYQLTPLVLVVQGVTVQSILPGTVEVTITNGTPTPMPITILSTTPTVTPTP